MVPLPSKPSVEEKKSDIEYFFRVILAWKDEENETNFAALSMKGSKKERGKARKYIRALWETGPEFKDEMIPVSMEMYSFASAYPVVRHIVRESCAIVYVTYYGVAQSRENILMASVYGTDIAVTLAVSIFEHLTSQYERGKNALTLSPRSSSSSSSSVLASFVEANGRNLRWNPEEVRRANLPEKLEELVVKWLLDDLIDMEYTVVNPSIDRPLVTESPVTRITSALSSASFHGVDSLNDVAGGGGRDDDAMTSGMMINGASRDDTITIEDDEELDLFVMEQTAPRKVSIISRETSSNLPPEYLQSLARDRPSGDINSQKLESYKRMNILQEHNASRSISSHPPPHPLVASSPHSPPNRPFADKHGHSPRPPSSKKIKGLFDQEHITNTGASKMDPVSNNSTKFKEDSPSSSSTIVCNSSTPGVINRKVKLKKNCSSDENNDNWMTGLTDEQIASILESTENIDNYSNYTNHMRSKNGTDPSHTAARLPPPPPHRLLTTNTEPSPASTMIIQPSNAPSSVLSSSPASMVVIPEVSLRRIVIDGSNVAMAHGNNKRFSCRGIKIVVEYFLGRGHERSAIKVYIPQWRQNTTMHFNQIDEHHLLEELDDFISYTPSRTVEGKKMNSYDDRFIVRTAAMNRGIIVSNDKFRDLIHESPGFKEVITYRLLPYAFCEDIFLPPEDPQGRNGPSLDEFLKIYRHEMELHEHARPKQPTPPYQMPPNVAGPAQQTQHHHQQQQMQHQQQQHAQPQQHSQQQPSHQPSTHRHVQVRPASHQNALSSSASSSSSNQNSLVSKEVPSSGFNFEPGHGASAAAAAAPVRSGHGATGAGAAAARSANVSPPRGRNQNNHTPRTAAETRDLRVALLRFFEGQPSHDGMIDEILVNFPKERDINMLASHVCALTFAID